MQGGARRLRAARAPCVRARRCAPCARARGRRYRGGPLTLPSEFARGFGVAAFRGLALTGGRGAWVSTADGRRYLDAGGASYGTMNVGHAHPRVVAAIERGSRGLTHVSQAFAHPARSRFVDAALTLAGPWAQRAFLSNSGTEAVETALKAAMIATGRSGVVAFEGGFHGRTLGALAATHKAQYREPFAARLGATTFAPYGDLDAAQGAITRETASVVVEPVQGEGGVRAPPPDFLRGLSDLCDEVGAMLVVDEVQTGIGRTGADLAIHRAGVEPDLLCLAKSIAAGLPLGVTLAGPRVPRLGQGLHGSTFGGSPLACEVGVEVLGILRDETLSHRAHTVGQRLLQGLGRITSPLVRATRGTGLMLGVELSARPTPVLKAMQERGVLALPAGVNVVRMLPPLVLTLDEADAIVEALGAALEDVERNEATPVVER